jgi:hypothetical protein
LPVGSVGGFGFPAITAGATIITQTASANIAKPAFFIGPSLHCLPEESAGLDI